MFSEEMANYAAHKALRKLGVGNTSVPGVLKVSLEMCQTAVANGSAIDVPEIGACVPILDRPIAQDEIEKVVLNILGETETHERADLDIISPSSDFYAVMVGGMFALLVTNADVNIGAAVPKGTYAVYISNEYGTSYVAEIHGILTETTTPISDKYLPGVCLPVVELTTQIPSDGSPVQFTAEENEAFEKAALSGMPAVIRFTFSPDGDMVVQMASIGSRLGMYIEGAGQMCGFRVHTDAETNFVFEGLNGHWGGGYMPTE
jgi:hypothetical protein